jgi:hypothetical protein
MSLILSLVARSPDVVLCEYSEFTGNFLQISRQILQKVKQDTKTSIAYDRYKFHYINENKITILSLSEGVGDDQAFAFLNDVKKKLLNNYEIGRLTSYSAFQLTEFADVLKQYMV